MAAVDGINNSYNPATGITTTTNSTGQVISTSSGGTTIWSNGSWTSSGANGSSYKGRADGSTEGRIISPSSGGGYSTTSYSNINNYSGGTYTGGSSSIRTESVGINGRTFAAGENCSWGANGSGFGGQGYTYADGKTTNYAINETGGGSSIFASSSPAGTGSYTSEWGDKVTTNPSGEKSIVRPEGDSMTTLTDGTLVAKSGDGSTQSVGTTGEALFTKEDDNYFKPQSSVNNVGSGN